MEAAPLSSFIFARVLGPTWPAPASVADWIMPFASWNLIPAARVAGPKNLVSLPGAPGPAGETVNPRLFKNCWRLLTSSPTLPITSWRLNEARKEALMRADEAGTAGLTVGTAGVAGIAGVTEVPPPPEPLVPLTTALEQVAFDGYTVYAMPEPAGTSTPVLPSVQAISLPLLLLTLIEITLALSEPTLKRLDEWALVTCKLLPSL